MSQLRKTLFKNIESKLFYNSSKEDMFSLANKL